VLGKALPEIMKFQTMGDFESVAKLWLQNKKYKFVNLCPAAMLWTLWKSRNDLVFQGMRWTGMRKILKRCASSMRNWKLLVKGDAGELERWAEELETGYLSGKEGQTQDLKQLMLSLLV
jgi:hypothetical protein